MLTSQLHARSVQGCITFKPRSFALARPTVSSRRSCYGLLKTASRNSLHCQATDSAAAEVETPSNSHQADEVEDIATILEEAEIAYDNGELDFKRLAEQINEFVSKKDSTAAADSQRNQTEAQNKYLRLSADFDNFRKRSAAERERQSDQVRGDVVKQLIPLVDSFEAAQASVKEDADSKIAKAYQGLYKQMVEIFKGLGIEAVPGAGQPFDPEFHDAILREENNDVPNNTVLQELRRGFKLGKTLLRPSMVKVSYTEEVTEPASEAVPAE